MFHCPAAFIQVNCLPKSLFYSVREFRPGDMAQICTTRHGWCAVDPLATDEDAFAADPFARSLMAHGFHRAN